MKKMFFTAVTLMAFSVASMANPVEEKKVVEPIKAETSVNAPPRCFWQAMAVYIELFNMGQEYEAQVEAQAVLENCD